MSTVLWINTLINGEVESSENDLYAIYKHSKKLDRISKKLGTIGFVSTHDFTDMRFNLSEKELPEGMESTNELMVQNGVWVSGSEAVKMLESLIAHITSEKIKFGFFKDDVKEVLNELNESLEIATKASNENGKFNYAVVM